MTLYNNLKEANERIQVLEGQLLEQIELNKRLTYESKNLEQGKKKAVTEKKRAKAHQRLEAEVSAVLGYLNEVAKTQYWLNSKANRKVVRARLCQGYQSFELKGIVTVMAHKWKNSHMWEYMRPSTLFNETKCQNYYQIYLNYDRTGNLPIPVVEQGRKGKPSIDARNREAINTFAKTCFGDTITGV